MSLLNAIIMCSLIRLSPGQPTYNDNGQDSSSVCDQRLDTVEESLGAIRNNVAELQSAVSAISRSNQGHIIVQQHFSGNASFNRTWAEFKSGFGRLNDDYWIGNDRLHQLTHSRPYTLRLDLLAKKNSQWYWAEYSTFSVDDESTGYRLHIGGYSGTAGDAMMSTEVNCNDCMDGMQFSTLDRDNDKAIGANCAVGYHGGFWYNCCTFSHLNASPFFVWSSLPLSCHSYDEKAVNCGLEMSRMTLI